MLKWLPLKTSDENKAILKYISSQDKQTQTLKIIDQSNVVQVTIFLEEDDLESVSQYMILTIVAIKKKS